jgi:TATA-box binding protein (TBP) (component of TFIID and TFIIIB)
MQCAWEQCRDDLQVSLEFDGVVVKRKWLEAATFTKPAKRLAAPMRVAYLEKKANEPHEDLSDERLRKLAKSLVGLPYRPYQNCLKLVPELVNLVSLADAIIGEGGTLPFDLRSIAQNVKGAIFYSPRRFTAVQLAFAEPRSRVLLFHTGRIVGTGSTSPTAAKLAVMKAMKCISEATGLHVVCKRFLVINQVGASSIQSRLDCDKFAAAHTGESHYDKLSFVGLAYRPVAEAICSEIYSTGKTNLPGSRRERDLLRSWSRMAPELQRFSTNPELADRWPPLERNWHRASAAAPAAAAEVEWEDDADLVVHGDLGDLAEGALDEGEDLGDVFDGIF